MQKTVQMVVDVLCSSMTSSPSPESSFWKCLSSSSSSEGGTFQLRRRDRRSGAVLGVVAMPVVVQRPGSGQIRQLWLHFSGGGTAAGEGGFVCLGRGAHHTGDEPM